MKLSVYLQRRPSDLTTGIIRIKVPDLCLNLSTSIIWPVALWHRGNPTGGNDLGLTATDLRSRLRHASDYLAGIPSTADTDRISADLRAILSGQPPKQASMTDVVDAYLSRHPLSESTASQLRRLASTYASRPLTASAATAYLLQRRASLSAASFNLLLGHLRRLLNYAHRRGLAPAIVLDIEPTAVAHNEPVYLTADQLTVIRTATLPAELEPERRRFLFQALTGLRASDIARLSAANIQAGAIVITLRKTSKAVSIPLNVHSAALLPSVIGQPVPPTSQRDRHIKRICRLAGLSQPVARVIRTAAGQTSTELVPLCDLVGTHTARRSFICNLLDSGASIETVMSLTGHSSYASIQPYISISREAKAKALARLAL